MNGKKHCHLNWSLYEIKVKIEERSPTLEEYNALRNAIGWWETEQMSTKRALSNSLYSVVVLEENKIVGIGRVIGDDGLYYYIQDLIVQPDYQGKGVGKELMGKLMNYIGKNATKGAFVGLMAAKGLEEFYKDFGFKLRSSDSPGMYKIIE